LRCTNADCMCNFWNRNVLGSLNIHIRALNELQPRT
jgi:hypothetical protein